MLKWFKKSAKKESDCCNIQIVEVKDETVVDSCCSNEAEDTKKCC